MQGSVTQVSQSASCTAVHWNYSLGRDQYENDLNNIIQLNDLNCDEHN